MAKRFVQKHNGTEMVLIDNDGHDQHYDAIEHVDNDEDFNEWAAGEGFACTYHNENGVDETYVKVRVNEDDYECMTQTEANEWFAAQDEE